jgi:hypothetical protein
MNKAGEGGVLSGGLMAKFRSGKISLVRALRFSLVFFGGGGVEEEASPVRFERGGMMREG